MGDNPQLQKSAQTVQSALNKSGLSFTVIELSEGARTAADAAAALGCSVAQIVKSLVFRGLESGQPILILVSGKNRVDEKIISYHVGEKIEKADATFTRNVTGFAIGGIPPVGHSQALETFIDQDLLAFQDLWAAAGTPHAVFCLDPATLVSLTKGRVVSVSETILEKE